MFCFVIIPTPAASLTFAKSITQAIGCTPASTAIDSLVFPPIKIYPRESCKIIGNCIGLPLLNICLTRFTLSLSKASHGVPSNASVFSTFHSGFASCILPCFAFANHVSLSGKWIR